MAYEIRQQAAVICTQPDFRRACKWLLEHACNLVGTGEFEIWFVEKRGKKITESREALFEYDR